MKTNLQIIFYIYFLKHTILDFLDFAIVLASIFDPTQRVLPNIQNKKRNIDRLIPTYQNTN